jgi:hypothetical protein
MKERAILNTGKVVEITAVSIIEQAGGAPAGCSKGWKHILHYANCFGFDFTHTDEKSARQRKTNLYTADGQRINPGRGERIIDAVVKAPILGLEHAMYVSMPVSLKAGDSRDITTDIKGLRGWVESGAPLWVYCINGEAEPVRYREGVVPYATGLTMQRIDVAEVIREQAKTADPWSVEGPKRFAFLRNMKVNGYTYPRFRINWKSVPSSLWLDAKPIPFNPSASLPSPWW